MCTCVKICISNIWVSHIWEFHVSGLVSVLFGLLIWSSQSLWLCGVFKRLYEAGIDSKCWRLIKACYYQSKCKVKVDGRTPSSFVIERGVRQDSVRTLSCLIPNCHESSTAADAATQVRGNSTWLVYRGICTCWWHQNGYLYIASSPWSSRLTWPSPSLSKMG